MSVPFIGSSKNPRCFRLSRYGTFKTRYRAQKNWWMDSNYFNTWVEWWYSEIRKKSNSPWLFIMNNCSGHESVIALPGLRIELLLHRSTAKYQPLNFRRIAHRKIHYRSNLSRKTISVMLERQSVARDFPLSSQLGIYGVQDRFLPTIGDALEIFYELWHATTRSAVLKCCIKASVYRNIRCNDALNSCVTFFPISTKVK